ncbi:MAG: efflux RND transporter periplasmic adaptor subunit [Pirellulaceae bacterium]|nr:efflux RND transporter periplasmic adaptor subunit [Pirellulaceae bacterium]
MLLLAICLGTPAIACGDAVESFTEPYRQIAVPAAEIGVLSQVLVHEGDRVTKHQLLAKLDDTVLQASLEVARAAKTATGALRSAEAENEVRKKQLESYEALSKQGNASERERERAENEQFKAAARLQSVREELEVRRLEYERAKAQIKQRQIQSPITGHVVAIEKEAGEFVSPNDPVVMHIVQLDLLKAVFFVPQNVSSTLHVGEKIELQVGLENATCTGVIEFISPTADPQSGSVRVKVKVPNPQEEILCGVACHWELAQYDQTERITDRRPLTGAPFHTPKIKSR